jgi:hypothetical protein
VPYDVEVLQLGACLPHEEFHQICDVLSRQNSVATSGYVVRRGAQHRPVHTNDVVVALSQVGCKNVEKIIGKVSTVLYSMSAVSACTRDKFSHYQLYLHGVLFVKELAVITVRSLEVEGKLVAGNERS